MLAAEFLDDPVDVAVKLSLEVAEARQSLPATLANLEREVDAVRRALAAAAELAQRISEGSEPVAPDEASARRPTHYLPLDRCCPLRPMSPPISGRSLRPGNPGQ